MLLVVRCRLEENRHGSPEVVEGVGREEGRPKGRVEGGVEGWKGGEGG